jgi:hypothetical protein
MKESRDGAEGAFFLIVRIKNSEIERYRCVALERLVWYSVGNYGISINCF